MLTAKKKRKKNAHPSFRSLADVVSLHPLRHLHYIVSF